MKHSPEVLLELADHFAWNDPTLRVVVASEGVGADWLRKQSTLKPRDNLILLPFQSFGDLPEMMASADVLVVLLERAAGQFSVPSKALSYLCAARPIAGVIPLRNAAANLIADRAEAGEVFEPGDVGGLIKFVDEMQTRPDLATHYAAKAREYAQSTFQIDTITDRFEHLLGKDAS